MICLMKHHGKHTDFWQHRLSLKTNDTFKRNVCWCILRCVQSCLKVWVKCILALFALIIEVFCFTWLLVHSKSWISSLGLPVLKSHLLQWRLKFWKGGLYYWWYIYLAVKPQYAHHTTSLRKKAGLFSPDCSLPFKCISNQVTKNTWSLCCKIMPAFLLFIIKRSPLIFFPYTDHFACLKEMRWKTSGSQ